MFEQVSQPERKAKRQRIDRHTFEEAFGPAPQHKRQDAKRTKLKWWQWLEVEEV